MSTSSSLDKHKPLRVSGTMNNFALLMRWVDMGGVMLSAVLHSTIFGCLLWCARAR